MRAASIRVFEFMIVTDRDELERFKRILYRLIVPIKSCYFLAT